ncbi:MAG: VirB3 family type IV secretion system protein [Fusobacterium varium]|uniref:VirB3 family type IV secretion system protein n=1 Tax=Fusobacterium varium TaxID=856 RepID=UPI00242D7094|nr:VirB3 family type IV secretion system protein [Fusobacterium varium]MCF0172070.1 VirB3 family type IV secretion system protein [Fusobacterium varium]MCF0209719.1 VirB3 family type IV secretion system protein [Bacteroidales bacterium]
MEGYQVPVCRALTVYPTIAGIPREAFIILVSLTFLFLVIYRAFFTLPIFIILYLVLRKVCKKDPLIIKIILKCYLKQRKYFYPE